MRSPETRLLINLLHLQFMVEDKKPAADLAARCEELAARYQEQADGPTGQQDDRKIAALLTGEARRYRGIASGELDPETAWDDWSASDY